MSKIFKTLSLLVALTVGAQAVQAAESCCKPGAKCCKPAAPCCK